MSAYTAYNNRHFLKHSHVLMFTFRRDKFAFLRSGIDYLTPQHISSYC